MHFFNTSTQRGNRKAGDLIPHKNDVRTTLALAINKNSIEIFKTNKKLMKTNLIFQ